MLSRGLVSNLLFCCLRPVAYPSHNRFIFGALFILPMRIQMQEVNLAKLSID